MIWNMNKYYFLINIQDSYRNIQELNFFNQDFILKVGLTLTGLLKSSIIY